MKISQSISLALVMAGSSSAFSRPLSMPTRTLTPVARRNPFVPGKAAPSKTALSLTDKEIDRLKDQAEETTTQLVKEANQEIKEATKFLYVDVNAAKDELAKNWGWIAGTGFLTMVLGFASLYVPLAATGAAYTGTVFTIAGAGVASLVGALARENGHKVKSALSGLAYLGLAYYMNTHPGVGLDIITLSIATVLGAEGMFETALAAKNANLQGRAWHFASGIGSVLASLFLAANIPAASLVTPGVALGARLTSNGATKVAVGFAGKEIADERKNKNSN